MSVSVYVGIINLAVGLIVVILSAASLMRLRGGTLAWLPGFFFVCSIIYVIHAGIEVFRFGEDLYAYSALAATFLFGLCLVVIDRAMRQMGS